jgi:hypothetical protein
VLEDERADCGWLGVRYFFGQSDPPRIFFTIISQDFFLNAVLAPLIFLTPHA